jgi:hypothetical protein
VTLGAYPATQTTHEPTSNRHQRIWCLRKVTQQTRVHTTRTVTLRFRAGHIFFSATNRRSSASYRPANVALQRNLLAIGQRVPAAQPESLYCNSHAMPRSYFFISGRNGN